MQIGGVIIRFYHNLNIKLSKISWIDNIRLDIKAIRRANIIKTLYFNFKMFPFKTAIKLPVWFYGKVKFDNLKGKIIFNCPVRKRLVNIGKYFDFYGHRYISSINLMYGSVWEINGLFIAGEGIVMNIGGKLSTGRASVLGTGGKISCNREIIIGNGTAVTGGCQVFDSNFHYIQNLETGEIKNMSQAIKLGSSCWIGNQCTISKGTVLPDFTIVCSNSLVNKDFSQYQGENILIGGSPAKYISRGIRRICDANDELKLHNYFKIHPNDESIYTEIPIYTKNQLENQKYEFYKRILNF